MMWVDLTSVLAHQPSNKPTQTKPHQINQRNKPTNQTKPSNQPHEYPGAAPLGLASLQGRLPSAAMSCSCSKTNIKTKPCYKTLVLKTFWQMFALFWGKLSLDWNWLITFQTRWNKFYLTFHFDQNLSVWGLSFHRTKERKTIFTFSLQTWKSLLPGSCHWWSAGLHSTQNCFMLPSILY